MTPDVVYDQLIGMGCARKLVFSWGGNPGVGSLHRFRDAVEHGWPAPLELEEHSHAGMAAAYAAGRGEPAVRRAARLRGHRPRRHTRTVATDRPARSPASGWPRCRALRPDVGDRARAAGRPARQRAAVGHHRRAEGGRAGARARSLVTVEEIVDELEPRPGAVVLPAWAVTAVAAAPGGAHPSYAHGYYERDNAFYAPWDEISRDRDTLHGLDAAPRARTATSRVPRACEPESTVDAGHTADEMMAVAAARAAARRHRLLRRHRPAEPGREPGAAHRTRPGCVLDLRERARSAPSRRTCRSRSATASWPRPPTRSSRCPRSSATGCRPAASTSASSAPPRSTASATSTRTVIGDYDTPKVRLPGAGGAPEIADACREIVRDAAPDAARLRRASSTSARRLRRRPGRASAGPARRG